MSWMNVYSGVLRDGPVAAADDGAGGVWMNVRVKMGVCGLCICHFC
jgi:hypothetical protein